jgi:4-carboxymuconolactone decarboxylase
MSLQHLDPATRALIGFAGAIATGEDAVLQAGCRECRAAEVPALWMDELLLQSVLMVGWPRALNAFTLWRQAGLPPADTAEDGADYSLLAEWQARGEAVCREVYGKNYSRLRENVRALHPILDVWMVTEGYGKTLGRPGLDLARRELCVAVQVAYQGAERQLHSHLRGALNAGASGTAVTEALELVRPLLARRDLELALSLWERIRP